MLVSIPSTVALPNSARTPGLQDTDCEVQPFLEPEYKFLFPQNREALAMTILSTGSRRAAACWRAPATEDWWMKRGYRGC